MPKTINGSAINFWKLLGAAGPSFRALDSAVTSGLGWHSHHRIIDEFIGRLRGKSIVFPYGFYPEGWGSLDVPTKFLDEVLRIRAGGSINADPYSSPEINWSDVQYDPGCDAAVQQGAFASPSTGPLGDLLPPECHLAHVQAVVPASWSDHPMTHSVTRTPATKRQQVPFVSTLDSQRRPLVIILAGTGEQGFLRRHTYIAQPLARAGIASITLESPFYGLRRPSGQVASKLRRVCDLPILGRVTLGEAHALVNWAHSTGQFSDVVLAGNSMGGLHSAMTAALSHHKVGVVSWLGPPSAAPVFTQGVLSSSVEWQGIAQAAAPQEVQSALQGMQERFSEFHDLYGVPLDLYDPPEELCTAPAPGYVGSMSVLEALWRYLSLTHISHFPKPKHPEAVHFYVADQDAYIPPPSMRKLWDWVEGEWAGCKLRQVQGGHVSATLFPPLCYSQSVVDVLHDLE